MISEQSKQTLLTLKNSAHGRALTELVEDALKELDNVSTITSWDDALGRKHAKEVVKKILYFLDIEKKVENSKNIYE